MRKIVSVFLIVILVLSFAGCSKEESSGSKTKTSDNTLYERGLKCMSLLEERQEFLSTLIKNNSDADFGSLKDLIENFCDCDLSDPYRIYQFVLDREKAVDFLEKELNTDSDDLPDYLKDQYMLSAINPGVLNTTVMMNKFNIPALMLSLINPHLSASASFVYKGLEEPESYLYLYKNNFPIQIVFSPGEDNTVMASIHIIIAEDFPTSAKGIKEYYSDSFGSDITKLFDLEKM